MRRFDSDCPKSVMLRDQTILDQAVDLTAVGRVVSMADGVATVSGLQGVLAGELVTFANEVQGLALNV